MESIAYQIKRTLVGALGYVYHYKVQFFKILIFPFIFFTIYYLIERVTDSTTYYWGMFFAAWIIYTQIAVVTHRMILLGPNSVPNWGIYVPTKRELHFFTTSFILGLMMIPITFLNIIPSGGSILFTIVSSYLISRFSLVFPSIAVDNAWSFSDSWSVTKDHQILMLTVILIFPIVISIPEILLSELPYTSILVTFISLITLIITIAALSVAFKVINESNSLS
jgi:hypothetical protein